MAQRLQFDQWQEEYRKKMVTAEEAARVVKSGDRVVLPNIFLGITPTAIFERRAELSNVEIQVTAPPYDPGWFLGDADHSFHLVVDKFLAPIARPVHEARRVDFLPYTNGTWWLPYRDHREETRTVDVFITQVSPPDEHGYCSFGANVWERKRYAGIANTVIAEINHNFIRTFGDNFIHVSEIDYFVDIPITPDTSDNLEGALKKLIGAFPKDRQQEIRGLSLGFPPPVVIRIADRVGEVPLADIEKALNTDPPDDVARGIVTHLKTVIRDGDTIQIGIGRPSKWMIELGVFDERSDLSIFSEMACPGMGNLVKRGIVTGRYATVHPGKAVFAGFSGFRWDEIQFADNNPMFELYGSDHVLDLANIIANHHMVSINNALQVDLIGQITCETQFGSRLINGPGGQIEFHIGAFWSKGGRAITLLPSTALQGTVSTIVPRLDLGSIVDIPRVYADIIITEQGIAQLATKTHRQRAEAMIEIAHPDFRSDLRQAASEFFGL